MEKRDLPTPCYLIDEAALRRCVGHDKKTAGGTVQLVIVRCMGQGELVTVPLSDLWEDKA